MDKALRPGRFDCSPNTTVAKKQFAHWFKTFENYLAVLPEEDLNKLNVLVNFLSPNVFELITECTTYDTAVAILKNTYICMDFIANPMVMKILILMG